MMNRLIKFQAVALACVFLTGSVSAQKATDFTGDWELGGKQRKYAATLILRQKGNRYPNFFAGERKAGNLSILAQPDLLGDSFTLKSKGGLQCLFHKMAPKPGMEKTIPGGVWGITLSKEPLEVTISGFTDWKMDLKAKSPTITARTVGFVQIGGKRADMEGIARFRFEEKIVKWKLSSQCSFSGKDLGLPSNQHEDIQLELFTGSPVSKQMPAFPSFELNPSTR